MNNTVEQLPTIDIKGLYSLLDHLSEGDLLSQHNIHLVGKPGIGKTRIIEQYFKNNPKYSTYTFHTLILSQMADPGDLTGLPSPDANKESMKFLPPWWHSNTNPVILFCDELLRARPEVIQPFFSLALDKTVAGRALPKGSIVIAASNYGDEFQQSESDYAFGSRFTSFNFKPSVEEWLDWAMLNKIDSRIVNYIRENHTELDGMRPDDMDFLVRTPDRRAWCRVNNLLGVKKVSKLDTALATFIAGEIGVGSAGAFKKFCDTHTFISPEILLNSLNFDELEIELQMLTLSDLINLGDRIIDYIKSNLDLVNNKTSGKQTKIKYTTNVRKFVLWCEANEQREAIGKLISRIHKINEVKFLWEDTKFTEIAYNYIESMK